MKNQQTIDIYLYNRLNKITSHGTCVKRKVGCLIVLENKVILEAFNGMPDNSGLSCLNGDCPRCATSKDFPHGLGYDLCFCLHAEEKAIANAAKKGLALSGTTLITSYQPCIMCLKKIVQSGISCVQYITQWEIPNSGYENERHNLIYQQMANSLGQGMHQIKT